LDINWIPNTGKKINCSGKPSDVFAAKDLKLLDIKTVFYSTMKRIS